MQRWLGSWGIHQGVGSSGWTHIILHCAAITGRRFATIRLGLERFDVAGPPLHITGLPLGRWQSRRNADLDDLGAAPAGDGRNSASTRHWCFAARGPQSRGQQTFARSKNHTYCRQTPCPEFLSPTAKLFETGRFSSGQAAGLIGMGRGAFLAELGRLGVSTPSRWALGSWTWTSLPPRLPVIIVDTSPVIQTCWVVAKSGCPCLAGRLYRST
ncbi:UPF0175 family protein [Lamprocystis purpurea]|uniref:UPF0175 family protein n=1 Tax=Lamprocystis purpurea TaxID=61598 RepID=UPI00389944DB